MTNDQLPTNQAAAPDGHNPDGSAERPAIVIVGRDPNARKLLVGELSRRYGMDYQIEACDQPAELETRLRRLADAGTPIALVIGAVGERDVDGIEVLGPVRAVDPEAFRVATARWGDWQTARPMFDAVTLGKIDHWVIYSEQHPDEEFNEAITQFLSEWRNQRSGGFEAVRVIGEQ